MVLRAHTEEVHLRAAQRPVDFEGLLNATKERVRDLGEVVQAVAEAQSVNLNKPSCSKASRLKFASVRHTSTVGSQRVRSSHVARA